VRVVREAIIETLTVFGSVGTLLCCALPALLVSIGAGAVMASLVTAVPQLVWISEHKIPLFVFAGLMLVISGVSTYQNRSMPCPNDPLQAKSCRRMRLWSAGVFFLSAALYLVGFYFAFVAARFA
jgi:hypothetical protein